MIRYMCDGCEEILVVEPALTVTAHPGLQAHFHGHKCLATWATAMTNIGWMGRPE